MAELAGARPGARAVVPLVLAMFLAGCSGGCLFGESLPGEQCFDPDDPCPNDMLIDESGCGWDRCAGGFTGNLMPCWYTEPGLEVSNLVLAGARAQYVAYLKKTDKFGSMMLGEIWLYDLQTGEHRQLTGPELRCRDLQADGDRIGCLDFVDTENVSNTAIDVYIKDIATGQDWRVPNPDRLWTTEFSLSGDRVVVHEVRENVMCEPFRIGTTFQRDLWLYDLVTGEKTLFAAAVKGSHNVIMGRVSGDRAVYWKDPTFCPTEHRSQLVFRDLVSGQERILGDWDRSYFPLGSSLEFDGRWAVGWMGANMLAWDVETGESKEVTPCNRDCHVRLDQGLVAYDRYGEDGLTQRQVYVANIASGEKLRLTDLRPYYDSAVPVSFHAGRLLWAEGRGKWIKKCGIIRNPEGKTGLYFWKDIEF